MSPANPWSASQVIGGALPDSREPAVALVAETLHVLWTCGRIVQHCYRTTQGGWSEASRVAVGEQPSVVATPDGRLHALFVNQFIGNYEIYYVFWDGGRWSLPENVSHSAGTSTQPALAVGPDGGLHAAWSDATPGRRPVVYYARRQGAFWTSAPVPSARGVSPAIAATPEGDLIVAWEDRLEEPSNCYDVFCSEYHQGQWNMPENVSDTPGCHSLQPVMATNVQGGCHILWQEERAGVYRIQHADRRPNTWATPVNVSATDADCRLPRIRSNRQGYLQAIWAEGQVLQHRVRPPDIDAAWWPPEVASDSCIGLSDLALAISRAGKVHAVWVGLDEEGAHRLHYLQREPVFRYVGIYPVG